MKAEMGVHAKRNEDPLALVIKAEFEAVAFFEKALSVATNPRVKEVMGRLVRAKRQHLRSFIENLRDAGIVPPEEGENQARIYPFDELRKAECYVCGYSTELESVPDSCPRCGASKYAFEKDITVRKAWELAKAGMQSTLGLLEDVQKDAGEKVRQALSKQMKIEQSLLSELRKELEGPGEK